MNTQDFFKRVSNILLARSIAGGLEINDTSIRFVSAESATLRTASVPLAPGVLHEGRIENREDFVAALRMLRTQILGPRAKRRSPVNVVVSLSSVNVYTQVFSLPFIEGDNLEKAVQLNIQMASPSGAADNYTGWQTLRNEDDSNMHLEVVTAFLPRGVADDLSAALQAGGFLAIALESRALSLARLIKQKASGVGPAESIVVVSADSSGLDVMIVRAGHLHFDYYNSWKDLQGGERQISIEAFRTIIARSVNQVMNFYNAHWKDPVSQILITSTGLKDEILNAIHENFDIKAGELALLVSPPVTPEWFVPLGGALRATLPRRSDTEISLLGVSAQQEYQREQVRSFLDFWRVLVPATLAILLVAFVGSWFLLNQFQTQLAPQASADSSVPGSAQLKSLRASATAFNSNVAMIQAADSQQKLKSGIFNTLLQIMTEHNITAQRLEIDDPSMPVSLEGTAQSEDDIIAFKTELGDTAGFSSISLPLTQILQTNTDYSFTITFSADPKVLGAGR